MLAKPASLSAVIDTIAGARKKMGTINNVNVRIASTEIAERSQKAKPRKRARQTKRYLLIGDLSIRDRSDRARYQTPAMLLTSDFMRTLIPGPTLGLRTCGGSKNSFEEGAELFRLEKAPHEQEA